MDQILAQGRVVRGWIGITGQDVTADLAAAFGLTKQIGVLVSGTVEQGPADQAGLRAGDVITQVDGRGIDNTQALFEAISGAGPERQLHLVGWRGSQRIQVSVRTVERPEQVQR
jgi:S1-C subfamily serine protease